MNNGSTWHHIQVVLVQWCQKQLPPHATIEDAFELYITIMMAYYIGEVNLPRSPQSLHT